MSRAVPEWVASHDDQAIPPRVKVRVFERFGGRCAICTLSIVGKLLPAYDHVKSLINGGKHCESNLQLLCVPCHAVKTRSDVAVKSVNARKRMKSIGIAPKKGRPFPGSKASGLRKRMNGEVERR